jgi:hypothetical protein
MLSWIKPTLFNVKDLKKAKVLLERGVNPNAKDSQSNTPII